MADKQILKGTTSQIREIFIPDTRQSDGSGLTGLVFNSSGLTAYYVREGAGSAVAIALATMTAGTWATGGFVEMDATNTPGVYQIGIPNLALASGANGVTIYFKGAANMAPSVSYIHLTAVDPEDGVRGGMTALPFAAAGATGGSDCAVTFGGTASAGSATTITLTGAVATDSYYNHQMVQILSGAGAGQVRVIVAYVGSSKIATVGRAWATNPDNTSVFAVKGIETTPAWNLLAGTLSAATSTTATLVGGIATDNYYNGALLVIVAGTGQRQARMIKGYVGSTTVATVDRAWATTPDNTSVFVVYGNDLAATDGLGNLSGSIASVTGAVGSVTGAVGSVTGAVGSVTAGVTVTTNNDKTGYTASTVSDKTGYALTSGERNSIADAAYDRDMAAGPDTNSHSFRNAIRFLRNHWTSVAGTLTVYKEDGTTVAYTKTLGTTPGANPVTSISD